MEERDAHTRVQHDSQVAASSSLLDGIVPVSDLPRKYRDAIDKGYSTGFRCIYQYMQGLRRGEVTVITADTGAGKTTFCTQLMVNVAMLGVPVWINSWEMKPETIMRKLASIVLRRP